MPDWASTKDRSRRRFATTVHADPGVSVRTILGLPCSHFFGRKIMRYRVALVGVGAAVCVLASLPTTAQAASHVGLATGPTVDFEMDEPVGSTVMTDSVGGVNGS